jgi:dolichol-phosphate mannosyltransferase
MSAVSFARNDIVGRVGRTDARARDVAPLDTQSVPLVFVVPAFNEAENLPRLFADMESRPELFGTRTRVLIVDDGSTDDTAAIVETYAGPIDARLVRMPENMGPGAAFRAGFETALESGAGDGLVVTLEADNTSDLDVLPTMIVRACAGADLVLASVHGGGRMIEVSLLRRVLSRGAGYLVRHALGLDAHTVSSFFRVYRGSALAHAMERYGDNLISERGFACKAELLAKLSALGAAVEEVPVDLDASQRAGESKMEILPTLAGYSRLLWRQRLARNTGRA